MRSKLIFIIPVIINFFLQLFISGNYRLSLLYAQNQENVNQYKPYDRDIPQGWKVIEGDIVVPDTLPTQGLFTTNLWDDGIVPYEFDSNVSPENRMKMIEAMAEWEAVAHIDFIPRQGTSGVFFLHIQNSTENTSMIGPIPFGTTVNICDWHMKFVMVHELGHAMGLRHEHSRSDRNYYIRINWENIEEDKDQWFEIISSAIVYPKRVYGLSDEQTYDFDSVMHYGQYAFSKNGLPTITVLYPNESWQDKIGQLTHLSEIDKLTMSFLYPQPNWYFIDKSHTDDQEGTFIEPYKDLTSVLSLLFPDGSVLWIQPGSYSAIGTYAKPLTIAAPLGNVILGQ